jgi:hypothetical protein
MFQPLGCLFRRCAIEYEKERKCAYAKKIKFEINRKVLKKVAQESNQMLVLDKYVSDVWFI